MRSRPGTVGFLGSSYYAVWSRSHRLVQGQDGIIQPEFAYDWFWAHHPPRDTHFVSCYLLSRRMTAFRATVALDLSAGLMNENLADKSNVVNIDLC